MGWASNYIDELKAGRRVSFRPVGGSMKGLIESGQLCSVRPIAAGETVPQGSIVLCRVGRAEYLHLAKEQDGERYLIGNNRGGLNGWIPRDALYGICDSVSD